MLQDPLTLTHIAKSSSLLGTGRGKQRLMCLGEASAIQVFYTHWISNQINRPYYISVQQFCHPFFSYEQQRPNILTYIYSPLTEISRSTSRQKREEWGTHHLCVLLYLLHRRFMSSFFWQLVVVTWRSERIVESLVVYFYTGHVLHTLGFHFVDVPLWITFFFFCQIISFSFLLPKFVLLLSHPFLRRKNQ